MDRTASVLLLTVTCHDCGRTRVLRNGAHHTWMGILMLVAFVPFIISMVLIVIRPVSDDLGAYVLVVGLVWMLVFIMASMPWMLRLATTTERDVDDAPTRLRYRRWLPILFAMIAVTQVIRWSQHV